VAGGTPGPDAGTLAATLGRRRPARRPPGEL